MKNPLRQIKCAAALLLAAATLSLAGCGRGRTEVLDGAYPNEAAYEEDVSVAPSPYFLGRWYAESEDVSALLTAGEGGAVSATVLSEDETTVSTWTMTAVYSDGAYVYTDAEKTVNVWQENDPFHDTEETARTNGAGRFEVTDDGLAWTDENEGRTVQLLHGPATGLWPEGLYYGLDGAGGTLRISLDDDGWGVELSLPGTAELADPHAEPNAALDGFTFRHADAEGNDVCVCRLTGVGDRMLLTVTETDESLLSGDTKLLFTPVE